MFVLRAGTRERYARDYVIYGSKGIIAHLYTRRTDDGFFIRRFGSINVKLV